MNFVNETQRLLLKIETPSASSKVLDFYRKNRPYFDGFELTRPDNFYCLPYQTASLHLEYNEIVKRHFLRFWIYEKQAYLDNPLTAPIIGSISLSHIRQGGFKSAMLGYKLDHDYWGQGYALEACKTMITLAFMEFHLHRLEAFIMPCNERSILLIHKLGFTYEGLDRSSIEVNHHFEDHQRYSLINPNDSY